MNAARRLIILAAVTLALGACSKPQTATEASASAPAPSEPYGFDVPVRFSPAALKKLADLKEKVTVAAYYSAEPTKEGAAKADEMGLINLGEERIDIDAADQTVHIKGTLDVKLLDLVIDHKPSVLINVFSARKSGPDNILDCGIFEGTVIEAQKAVAPITCSLISENVPPKA